MQNKFTFSSNQTLIDVAIEVHGSTEGLFLVMNALENPSIFGNRPGFEFEQTSEILDKNVVNLYSKKNIKPASEIE